MGGVRGRAMWGGGLLLLLSQGLCALALAQEAAAKPQGELETAERPTVERRFAPKRRLLYGQVTGMTHLRDDFMNTWGVGGDLGYFPWEWLGLELRALGLTNALDDSAIDLKERLGLTPDAYAQNTWWLAGLRFAPGYGKMLMFNTFVIHFDPQIVLHGGFARAQDRWLPTFTTAFSLMTHWHFGIKATLDLGLSIQQEERDRGSVWTLGFAPVLGLGWGWNL